ncbi:NUDIX hydrolase [Micrococcus terreus]|uniref:NUDIX hydrolase n=1 Tax=Micrococcus terreus TaxID=574650 RepID=UPI0023F79B6B|nr:NUDIX domain-containing protein [Micrococcus terreus]
MSRSGQDHHHDDGPPPVRPAATILLVRPVETPERPGLEVLTLTRSTQLVFSAGATAFPGGRIEDTDPSPEYAAVRETFEETGVLLAARPDGSPADVDLAAIPAQTQGQIEEDAARFSPFLTDLGVQADVGSMHLISRWVTPEDQPRRYDTRFYVAAVPAGQEPRQLSFESASWQWLTPEQALSDFRAGERFLMPPTWAQLRLLAQAATVQQALHLPGQEEPVTPRSEGGTPRRIVDFPDHEVYALDLEKFHAHRPRSA